MLNFAEQTGSGAVMLVWSFLLVSVVLILLYIIAKSVKICNSTTLNWMPVPGTRTDLL